MEASLSAALASGLTLDGFYASTPYLTRLHVEASSRARLTLAWHTEALARTDRLPSLSSLLGDEEEGGALADADEIKAWLNGHPTMQ